MKMWFQVAGFLLGILIIDFVVEVLPDFLREVARRRSPLVSFPDWEEHLIPFEMLVPGDAYRAVRGNNARRADAWALEAGLRGFDVLWVSADDHGPEGWQISVPEDYRPYRRWAMGSS